VEALVTENDTMEKARNKSIKYAPELLPNEDTLKQLLARSRYLLYKPRNKWTENQSKRAAILLERYPDLEKAYKLCQNLSWIFNSTKNKTSALIDWQSGMRKLDRRNSKALIPYPEQCQSIIKIC